MLLLDNYLFGVGFTEIGIPTRKIEATVATIRTAKRAANLLPLLSVLFCFALWGGVASLQCHMTIGQSGFAHSTITICWQHLCY